MSIDDFVFDWDGLLPDNLFSGELETPPIKEYVAGYKFNSQGVIGRTLFNTRMSTGKNLVIRLKERGQVLSDEVEFWGEQLADLARIAYDTSEFDFVTSPPSSEKTSYHLATNLAEIVARKINVPYAKLFINLKPRKTKSNLQGKLKENKQYKYVGEQGKRLLIVDDIVFTRTTAKTCLALVDNGPQLIRFIFIYG